MAIGPETASLLGISEDATPNEVEERHRAIAEFFTSEHIPPALREWAREQRARLDQPEDLSPLVEALAATDARVHQQSNPLRGLGAFVRSPLFLGAVFLVAVVAGVVVARTNPLSKLTTLPKQEHGVAAPLDNARLVELARQAESDPAAVSAFRELARSYFVAGQWQTAIDWLAKILAVDGKDLQALKDIGTASFNVGKTDDAKAFWLRALAISPDDPLVHYSLGHYYATVAPKDNAAARKEFQEVLRLAPGSSMASSAQARIDVLPTK